MSKTHKSSPFPSCFRPLPTKTITSAATHHRPPPSMPPSSPNLTTTLYQTDYGLFALTWSRRLFNRSFHLHFLPHDEKDEIFPSQSSPVFHLEIKPFVFWKKQGSKNLDLRFSNSGQTRIFWDFSRAKFGSGPEPGSRFFVAVVIGGEMVLLVGDSVREACAKTKARKPGKNHVGVLRREHVYAVNKMYTTKAKIGGKEREISIDCRTGENPRLYFELDGERVLQVKHLKWKFRGNERIEIDGVSVQVSWDVYNWLFDDDEDGYGLFMFRFEDQGFGEEKDCGFSDSSERRIGFGFETKMMKKGLMRRTARSSFSSSSSSLSSVSSSCGSVMEWASVEENELKSASGFSLLVYAWKS